MDLPSLLGALVSDIVVNFTPAALPSNTVGQAVATIFDAAILRRRERARSVLLKELSNGTATIHDAEDVDELVSIVNRYFRAADEGAAVWKLHLISKLLAGQCESRSINADEFLSLADMLVSMRREEIIYATELYKEEMKYPQIDEEAPEHELISKAVLANLVPRVFLTESEMYAVATAVQRTGLIEKLSTWGGRRYTTTPLMNHLVKVAKLSDAGIERF